MPAAVLLLGRPHRLMLLLGRPHRLMLARARGYARDRSTSATSTSGVASMLSVTAYLRSMSVIALSYTVGDTVCQFIEASAWRNPRRTAEFAVVGGLLMAPMSHTLEAGLERIFPGASLRPIAAKVISRIFIAPIFLCVSFGSIAVLRGEPIDAALRAKVLPAWKVGLLFWPAVSALTYRFIPVGARPATGAMVGSVWSCYLSWVAFSRRADAC
jgi:hypothetical protein